MIIFAYGSNMNTNRLKQRVPSAVKVINARLLNYRLAYNKISIDKSSKANIVADNSAEVWGVIFEIDSKDKISLDRAEGLGNGYDEKFFNLIGENGQEYTACGYIATDNKFIDDNLKPYDWYYEYIRTGAVQNKLPVEYIEKLTRFEFIVDSDDTRRKKNLDTLG